MDSLNFPEFVKFWCIVGKKPPFISHITRAQPKNSLSILFFKKFLEWGRKIAGRRGSDSTDPTVSDSHNPQDFVISNLPL